DCAVAHDLIAHIGDGQGALAGVIHAAGVTDDGLIAAKTPGRMLQVMAPKVQGTWNLDAATAHLPLDFFVLFSSVGAVLGNVGQADYAYANAFLDAFCEVRERWRSLGYRSGRSCAIDWGLWRDGGMQVPADTLRAIARTTGMVPMETGSALDALRHA